jgi:hypothetical protein
MVQIKYFGDKRDYFKYDLITSIFQEKLLNSYVFIPMLTDPRDGNEGNKIPINSGDKSQKLFDFIATCKGKSLDHWERWLTPYVFSYQTVKPADEILFRDKLRAEYWPQFTPMIKKGRALIFADPDTGLQTGRPSYRKRMGPEKYMLDDELSAIFIKLHIESLLMIYQHLPNNKHNHECAIRRKLEQVQLVCINPFTCAYREDDLAFIFVAKSKILFMNLLLFLKKYHEKSKHRYKTLVELDN